MSCRYCAALVVVLASTSSWAQQRAADRRAEEAQVPPPTFAYTTTAVPRPVRAAVETGGVLAVGFVWYAATRQGAFKDGELGYSWSVFRDKLTGRAFGPDTNHFGTNFIGHPLGGTGYYLAARSNRLSILESLGYSIAGSFIWELFGEVSEVVSLNDTLVTPLAGLAIGESTTQLAGFLDRSAPTTGNRVVAAVVGAPKTLNDALDDLEPRRAARGFPANEWHRFEMGIEGAVVRETDTLGSASRALPEGRVELSSRLVRLPGWDQPGDSITSFADGNASRTRLRVASGGSGITDIEYTAEVTIGGAYFRSRSAQGGGNGFVGLSSGFVYALHDYERDTAGPIDRWSVVRPFSVTFEHRGAVGASRIGSRVDAGADFGGVRPLAASSEAVTGPLAPPILRHRGYYFGLGGHVTSSLELEVGSFETGAEMSLDALRGVGGPGAPVRLRLEDWRSKLRARVGYRVPSTPAAVHTAIERRTRFGSVGRDQASAGELSVAIGAGAVF